MSAYAVLKIRNNLFLDPDPTENMCSSSIQMIFIDLKRYIFNGVQNDQITVFFINFVKINHPAPDPYLKSQVSD
jgi:hypothetical protein